MFVVAKEKDTYTHAVFYVKENDAMTTTMPIKKQNEQGMMSGWKITESD